MRKLYKRPNEKNWSSRCVSLSSNEVADIRAGHYTHLQVETDDVTVKPITADMVNSIRPTHGDYFLMEY